MTVLLAISVIFAGCQKNSAETITPGPTSTISPKETVSPAPTSSSTATPFTSVSPVEDSPVDFIEKTMSVNGRQNKVFMLSIDVDDSRVTVEPYLSFGKTYGFETLTEMAETRKAIAGVNSGFFFEYGRPSGLVVIDGETVSPGSGRFESIFINKGEISFEVIQTEITVGIGDSSFETNNFNVPCSEGEYGVYSSFYGNTDRLDINRKYIVTEGSRVLKYGTTSTPKGIPENGYSICLPSDFIFPEDLENTEVKVYFFPVFETGTMAYEGASMIIKDGESLAGDSMPWVGNLNHYDPRTCIGLLSDGKLGVVVIDGRQEGYSTGTTGRETADLLLELGFTDAFMLDGGASSAMYYDGEIVNNPSDMGIERILAGSILVFVD